MFQRLAHRTLVICILVVWLLLPEAMLASRNGGRGSGGRSGSSGGSGSSSGPPPVTDSDPRSVSSSARMRIDALGNISSIQCTISVSPASVYRGNCSTLILNVTPRAQFTSGTLDGSRVTPDNPGSFAKTVCPGSDGTHTFSATVVGAGAVGSCTGNLVVNPPPRPSCRLYSNRGAVYGNCGWTEWFLLTMIPTSIPISISSAHIDGTWISPTGGSVWRNWYAPYHNPARSFYAYVYGPSGSNYCGTTVAAHCPPRAPYGIDVWYNYPNWDPPLCTWTCCNWDWGRCWNRGCGRGCFSPDSKILLANGLFLQASKVKAGMRLWNPVKKKGVLVRKVIAGPEPYPLIRIGYGEYRVDVTTKHPMVTREGLIMAENVIWEDQILGADNQFHPINHLEELPLVKDQVVYNFQLDSDSEDPDEHMILADGVVTGDHQLQMRLQNNEID